MRDFWENIKARLIRLGGEDVQLFGRTVKLRAVLAVAALIVVLIALIPIVISLSNREIKLHYESTDVEPGYAYRFNDGILFYETPQYYVSMNPTETNRVGLSEKLNTADGFDISSAVKIVYLGSQAQIVGPIGGGKYIEQQPFSMAGGEQIVSARAGRRFAAILYRNQYGDTRISIMDARTESAKVVATLPITGGEVTAFGFLEPDAEHELLWVATLDTNQFTEESLVRIYNCDGGGTLIFYSASLYNQTVENAFLTERCLFLVGTQDILRYDRTTDGFSSLRGRVSIYGSRVVDCRQAGSSGDSAYFITMPLTAEDEQTHLFRLITVSQSDEMWATVLQQFISAPIVTVFLAESEICVITNEDYETYSYSGKSTLTLPFDETPTRAIPYGEGFLLFTQNACRRVTVG